MEKRFAGPRAITIQGLNAGTLDVTLNNWGHEVHMSFLYQTALRLSAQAQAQAHALTHTKITLVRKRRARCF